MKKTQSGNNSYFEAEQDFRLLDRLMEVKPKALESVYESIIIFTRNKTGEWRVKLSAEDLKKAMNFARNSKTAKACIFCKEKED